MLQNIFQLLEKHVILYSPNVLKIILTDCVGTEGGELAHQLGY